MKYLDELNRLPETGIGPLMRRGYGLFWHNARGWDSYPPPNPGLVRPLADQISASERNLERRMNEGDYVAAGWTMAKIDYLLSRGQP